MRMLVRSQTFRLLQSTACLVVTILLWRSSARLEVTEFSGGRVTGPLLYLANLSIFGFVLSIVFNFFNTRLSAAATVAASFLASPVYLYFLCPGPFRYIFK